MFSNLAVSCTDPPTVARTYFRRLEMQVAQKPSIFVLKVCTTYLVATTVAGVVR